MIFAKAGTAVSWQNVVTALVRHGQESQGPVHQRSSHKQWGWESWTGGGLAAALRQIVRQQPEAGCHVRAMPAALAGLTSSQRHCPMTTVLQWCEVLRPLAAATRRLHQARRSCSWQGLQTAWCCKAQGLCSSTLTTACSSSQAAGCDLSARSSAHHKVWQADMTHHPRCPPPLAQAG